MKTIAVVEDNPDNRLLVRVILEPFYSVVEYETGFAALEGLRRQKPNLVLLNVSLPGMDGTEVLGQIRADPSLRGLPVFALTAHAMAGDQQKFIASGFDDYISKPILDETILLDAILRKLPGSRPANTAPKTSELNSVAIERLQRLGGDQFAVDMLDLFLTYGAQKLAEARAACQAGELEALADAVHPIKSSAGNVGATRIQELCASIEDSARRQTTQPLAPQLADLEQAFAEAKPRLETEKARLQKKS